MKLPGGLASLGYRDFFLYWIGLGVTNAGRWVELTGVVWLVYEMTESPLLVGALGAARAVPAFLFSPMAGVVADRSNPRFLLLVCQGLAIAAALCLGLLIVLGKVELWHVYIQVAVQAVIQTFDATARQTLYPRLVPRHLIANALMLSVTAARLSKFVGPALGGILIANLGTSAPFFANALSYLGLMFGVLAMRPLILAVSERTSLRAELMEGVRYILDAPVLSGLLTLEIVFALCEMNPVMIAIIGRELLGVGPQALGFLLAAPALGSLAGIAWMLMRPRHVQRGRFSILCAFGYAGVLVFLALSWSYAVSFAALLLIGLLQVLMAVNRSTIMQLAAPEQMRGRVMANMGVITRGIGPLSETQSGALASLIGASAGIMSAAALMATAAVLVARNKALWTYSTSGQKLPD